MNVSYYDESIFYLYSSDKATNDLLNSFSIMSLFVSALGLFGLAVYSAERRTREIGIRKVLGANIPQIVKLMVWQFSKPVIWANLLAWPLAWFFMDDWLKGFVTRIDLSLIFLIVSGGLVLGLAWVTVASHAIRVARANPIHALREE